VAAGFSAKTHERSWPSVAPPNAREPATSTLVVTNVVRPRVLKAPNNGRFVVELAKSARPFSPHSVPHLDLFGLYRLYHHLDGNDGHVCHSLRLGFFSEARAAEVIARYAAAYFESPVVAQIGVIEEAQSGEHLFRALRDVGATDQYAAIELTAPPPLPLKMFTAPVHPAKAAPAPRHPPSLWARLFAPQLR
jgi:hypothetical protein